MRASAILLALAVTLMAVGEASAAAAGKAAPAGKAATGARPAPATLPEVSNLIDQFKSYVADASAAPPAPAQLEKYCASIVTAALPALESDDASLHQVGRTLTLDFAFHVSRPGAEAERLALSKALAAKVAAAKPQAKVWICRLFQHIGRDECIPALAAMLGDADADTSGAAARALQKNPAAEAGTVLAAALAKADKPAARVDLIMAVAGRGDPATAAVVAKCLADKDELVSTNAAYGLGRIGGTEAVKALTAAKGSATGKVLDAVLDGLLLAASDLVRKGSLDDAAAIYRDLDVAASPARIRVAALRGSIIAGGEKSVPVITEALTGTDTAKRALALSLLPELRGPSGTKALIELMPKLNAAERAVVLNELAARKDAAAKPAIILALASEDADLQAAALQALGSMGDETDLPAILKLLSKATRDADRRNIERVAGAICARSTHKEACAAAILKDLSEAQGANRVSLLALAGQTGAKPALAALVTALKDADTDVQAAAIRGMAEWPTPEPAPPLLAYAKAGDASVRQAAALRGFVHLASLGQMPAADRTKMYAEGLAAASRPADRTMVLSEMGNAPSAAALPVIQPLLAGDSKNEAAAAIVKIAAAVGALAPAEAKTALQQVIDSSVNENMKGQARQALAAVEKLPPASK
jgi:HEAT repeat protein